ncbi:hypothetical protein D3C86_1568030 [compost metagenome]
MPVALVRLDDGARRVVLLGQLDGSVRQRAAARAVEPCCHGVEPGAQPGAGIVRMSFGELRPEAIGLLRERAQVLRHQRVLRLEVAIQRHLVGARGLGDALDPHRADAVPGEERAGRCQEALARGLLHVDGALGRAREIFSHGTLDFTVTDR